MSDGHGKGGPGAEGPKPGDGYRVEIASVRRVLTPLEESVVAAGKIKKDWKALAESIGVTADFDIYSSSEKMLSSWGFGMGRVADQAKVVVETLRQVIAAYMLADLLRIKDFAPTEDNIAKLPFGEHGMKAWKDGYRPKFDPPPEIYQEPWLDDDGTTVTGDVPTNPRLRYDGGGWESDGGGKGTIA
ncbi:hypothetical protein HUT19_35330 [Streptomyces sp. NA02950]|uniref:hypothetical protein n=1 Tax=Streptomyces sp. NA02950 TaxID=2742137 RepID=UPI0015925F04|nr:hypothetical protein [Streptomyces sp. NA02950]QKV96330.1 hypothetical protein HUT19_35330 [Streptomyces sp. NA02950]